MRYFEFVVGLFMLLGIAALFVLALNISGLTRYAPSSYYVVTAEFDNIGDLKVRAPVRIAGVRVGEVKKIELDKKSYRAKVFLEIQQSEDHLPADTAASIYTAGLLGSNYVSLAPGYADTYLKEGSRIEVTHPALVLENLIGQLLFQSKPKPAEE